MPIVTIDDMRIYLTFEAASDKENFLQDHLIPSAEKWALTRLGFDPSKITHEETHIRNGEATTLTLNRYPISSVEEVLCDGAVVDGWETDMELGTLFGCFGPGRWKVKFTTQATNDPDIKDAVCQLVAWKFQLVNNEGYGVKNRIQGDLVISMETNVPRAISDALDAAAKRYRK